MFMTRETPLQKFMFFLSNALLVLSICSAVHSSHAVSLLLPSEAQALLAFKSKADLRNQLLFLQNKRLHFCQWLGVICYQQKVVRLVLEDLDLGGIFTPNSLTRLDHLRVPSLQNNSLTGPIPDLLGLMNLKSLFLDHNFFTGTIPPSVLSLHPLKTLDLSYNNLTGTIPKGLTKLDLLYSLRLDVNRFNGSIPSLNQSSLKKIHDNAYAVNRLSHFMSAPIKEHWKGCKNVLRYLKETLHFDLEFHSNQSLDLIAFADADWACDLDDRKSVSEFFIYLASNLISWSSKKQPVVARSSVKSEYRTLALTYSEIFWIVSLLTELHITLSIPPIIWSDSFCCHCIQFYSG